MPGYGMDADAGGRVMWRRSVMLRRSDSARCVRAGWNTLTPRPGNQGCACEDLRQGRSCAARWYGENVLAYEASQGGLEGQSMGGIVT